MQTARPLFCLTSVVQGEDEGMVSAILAFRARAIRQHRAKPLWIYVPRSAQRFDEVFRMLRHADLNAVRRSECLTADLQLKISCDQFNDVDVLLGDSFGEMNFYMQISDHVTVGGSFSAKGSHNIIEPLALRKPVAVGPVTWTIEYPANEAFAAGVLTQMASQADLPVVWEQFALGKGNEDGRAIDQFLSDHAGATAKHLAILSNWLSRA
jgi:3-deoxy-D-manno-octulosonic-acid transferase